MSGIQRKQWKRWLSAVTAASLLFGALPQTGHADEGAAAGAQVPPLLITELVPDTANVGGSDAYEFIEVYNNTDKALDFSHYKLSYRYPDQGPSGDVDWLTEETGSILIPVGGSIVLWVTNAANKSETANTFNANFGTSLTQGVNLFRLQETGGMANGSPRDLVIKDRLGNEIVIASYQNDAQTVADKGIFYAYPTDGSIAMRMLDNPGTLPATPGATEAGQVPDTPVASPEPGENAPPVIGAITHSETETGIEVSAVITDADGTAFPEAKVYYRTKSQTVYASATLVKEEGSDRYKGLIPRAALVEEEIYYYIEAMDAWDAVTSEPQTAAIDLSFDPQAAPPLLITEIVPDSTNIGSADGYEFVEVYNNTDQPLNLKDYRIRYRYTDSGPSADVIWPTSREDIIVPSKGTVVFWVINSLNQSATAEQFNANYKTALVEDTNLFRMFSDGMANGGKRGMVIATNSGIEISAAYYDNDEETKADKGIFYKYPADGTSTMIKYSAGLEAATPGSVAAGQVPAVPVTVTADTTNPEITDLTPVTQTDQSGNFDIVADAADDRQVKTVLLYYKDDRDAEYTKRYLTESYNDSLYRQTIFSPQLIGRQYIEYYFEVSDGTNVVETEPKRIAITGGQEQTDLRLNIAENEVLAGTKILRGTGKDVPWNELSLSIDGTEVAEGAYSAVESGAYFAFETQGVNYYFKNAVVADGEILHTFLDPIDSWSTLSIPIPADRLLEGGNVISVYAGSKSGPFDDRPEENKDDFEIRNVRLVLADGTELYDPKYASPLTSLKMGDSAGRNEFIDFTFTLTPAMLASKAYAWDTRNAEDGQHEISVTHDTYGTLTRNVKVDNTAPVIAPAVEEGETYRGPFTIDAAVSDAVAGIGTVEATLDGEAIALPLETSSAKLSAGSHTLVVKATDKVGNAATSTVTFQVPDENPAKPELVSPADGASRIGDSATLKVKAQDPLNDPMRVSFFRGFSFDASSSSGFKAYRGASDTEPPKQEAPGGETAFTASDLDAIRSDDGQYLTDDAVEQFPYQRFEITLDPSVKNTDRVAIKWQGKSLEGRQVSLYAWSPAASKWDRLDTIVAGSEDFELGAEVAAGDYRKENHTINLMVQDEVAVSNDPYDFSFVWMSDTQYYSETAEWHKYFRDNVNWIKNNLDSHKIKYVIHTGDIVDESDKEYQWIEADANMKVLDEAGIPYGVLAGNHDVDHQQGSYDNYWKWFGEERFVNQPTFGGSYKNNMGHYDLVSAGGNDFIIVYMGWGLADEEIEWMNQVVKEHPNRKAIIALHEYLLVSGNRAPIADKVYEQVVLPNKNVFATLSGHYHDAELKTDEIDDDGDGVADRKVYQMLADYQGAEDGGLGYIRLMQFDMANDKLHIKTYSPTLNDYNYYDPAEYPSKDEFSLDLDLDAETKRVATDYFGVQIYTDKQIGETQSVESGATASAVWSGLAGSSSYGWYAIAEDEHEGVGRSDVWRFYTGPRESGGFTPPPQTGGQAPAADNGVVSLEPKDGSRYEASAGAVEAAIQNAGAKAFIEFKLNGKPGSADKIELQLPGEAWSALLKNGKGMKIVTPAVTIEYPADAIPAEAAGSGTKVTLALGTELKESELTAAENSDAALQSTGIGYSLELLVAKGDGTADSIHQFGGMVRVTVTLTYEERDRLDPDYAGVYYLDGKNARYMGGVFEGETVTFETNHFSSFAVMEYRKSFTDMAGHWASAFVEKLAAKHAVTGIDAARFVPDRSVTRADFAVIAVKALGFLELKAESSAFTDVEADQYYAAYVQKAYELGLVSGYEDDSFRPEKTISREEAAVILMRLYDYLSGDNGRTAASDKSFSDIAEASDWARGAIEDAYELGLVGGKGSNRFDPQAEVTRAEIAKMIWLTVQP
ncbi:metallophosphoesterase [Paenibacillus nanensis]|uniref:Metallophosphoesterase n=1 Tax=Paenibacillus nanensis TaxID=393251 RepID=A0A3A1URB2_9BACL|nr:S-layer homology domain-containing protein [Paenibacillus nanensis]RIX49243.1 metallophosphoesterase [Paenibacillus nanensis]